MAAAEAMEIIVTLAALTVSMMAMELGVVVQQTGFRRHLDFNHNDIYHIIQIAAFYLFFRGACTLRDRQTVPTR